MTEPGALPSRARIIVSDHGETVTALDTAGRWLLVGLARGALLGVTYSVVVALIAAAFAIGSPDGGTNVLMITVVYGVPVGLVVGLLAGLGVAAISALIDVATGRQRQPHVIALTAIAGTAAVLVVGVAASRPGDVPSTLLGLLVFVAGPAMLATLSVVIAPLPSRRQLGRRSPMSSPVAARGGQR